jgi:hypothetical protein
MEWPAWKWGNRKEAQRHVDFITAPHIFLREIAISESYAYVHFVIYIFQISDRIQRIYYADEIVCVICPSMAITGYAVSSIILTTKWHRGARCRYIATIREQKAGLGLAATDESMMNNECSEDRFTNSAHANGLSVRPSPHGAGTWGARWRNHAKVKCLLWYNAVSDPMNRQSSNEILRKVVTVWCPLIYLCTLRYSDSIIQTSGFIFSLYDSTALCSLATFHFLNLMHSR